MTRHNNISAKHHSNIATYQQSDKATKIFKTMKSGAMALWRYGAMIIVVMALWSCERNEPDFTEVDCNYCYAVEPDSAELWVELDINEQNPYVALVVYRGRMEDNIIEYVDTAYSEEWFLWTPVEKYYTVKAKYIDGQDTVYVVDGDKLKTTKNSTACNYECWVITGGFCNVKLNP